MTLGPGVSLGSFLPSPPTASWRHGAGCRPRMRALCLRCWRAGGVRKYRVVPKYEERNNFGHSKENCVCRYAPAIIGALCLRRKTSWMKPRPRQRQAVPNQSENVVKSPSGQASLSEPAQEGSDDPKTRDDAARPEASTVPPSLEIQASLVSRSLRRPGLVLRRRRGRPSLGRHRLRSKKLRT